jgi:hypothetical protein
MKRLVICCDGTWQRLYGDALTNVALTARSVASRDAQGHPQIVFYSAGVGASVDGLSLWQGMTGDDLDDNLLEAWTFLNLNYEPGDQLYLFGFSRGAYTVRSLAGLLRKIGILRRAHVDTARESLPPRARHRLAAPGRTLHGATNRSAHPLSWRLGHGRLARHSARAADLAWPQQAIRVSRHRALALGRTRAPCRRHR